MKDQQEAEAKKVMSQDIQTAIMAQTKVIDEKQHDVKADLAQVEPAVIEAQQGQLRPVSAFILINKWILIKYTVCMSEKFIYCLMQCKFFVVTTPVLNGN